MVGNDLALELLHAENGLRNLDLEVFLDLHLAAEPPVVLDLLPVEEADLGREDGSATFIDLDLALAAVRLSTAGGRQEDVLLRKSVHEVSARLYVKVVFSVVDIDFYCALRAQFRLYPQKQHGQDKCHNRDGCCGGNDSKTHFIHISASLIKVKYP